MDGTQSLRSLLAAVALAAAMVVGSIIGATALAAPSMSSGDITLVTTVSDLPAFCPAQCVSGPDALVSKAWADVPGVTSSVTVPANTRAEIVVRFDAAGSCFNYGSGYCAFRVMVGGQEAGPELDTLITQPGYNGGSDCFTNGDGQCHMQRSIGPLNTGTYQIKVKYMNLVDGTSGQWGHVDSWSLTVERIRV
jgi:hypothetical protein